MKHAFLAAALVVASSVAFADPASVLLDGDKVGSMSAEEYAAAVSSAPDVNVRNKDGLTPLHFAAGYGTPDNIAALVSEGADVETRTKYGETPLHFAAKYWSLGIPVGMLAIIGIVGLILFKGR